jgi:hypothetical protein
VRREGHLEHNVAQAQVAGEYAGEGTTATRELLFDHVVERVAV